MTQSQAAANDPRVARDGHLTDQGKGPAKLVSGSVRGHVIRQTWPLVVGVAAIMSVGIVDAIFIGRLGKAPLAAVSFIFPITTALSSIGVGVMVGIASVVSRSLGQGDAKRALALANLGFVLATLTGAAVGLLLYLLRMPLFRLMQADETLLPLIDAYMAPYALGFVLQLSMMGFNGALRAQGAANRSMVILLVYAAGNWILDPILISGAFGIVEGYGIAGAAYATIGSWVLSSVVGFFLLNTSALRFSLAAMRESKWRRDTIALARVGGPAALANSINPVGLAVLTALLAQAGQDAVAGYGAAGRLQSFAIVPLLGLSGAIGAIVGQNFGADKHDRVRQALRDCFVFSLAYGAVVAVILVVFRSQFSGLFTQDGAVREEFESYLLIGAWAYGGFGIFIVANGAFNAVDRASLAFWQSLARVVLVMMPVALVLRGSMGSSAIYWAEFAANLAGAAIAGFAAWKIFWSRGPKQERA